MSLMSSRQPKTYRWQKGELLTATEACELLGYKCSMQLRDPLRRERLEREFEQAGCRLTLLVIGSQYRFLRSEIDEFLTAKYEAAQKERGKRARFA